jgi:hypothetical protein
MRAKSLIASYFAFIYSIFAGKDVDSKPICSCSTSPGRRLSFLPVVEEAGFGGSRTR